MNHVSRKKQGFTIIELVLSMSFVAVLLLAIATIIMQIGATYNRGMTVKEVNQAGRSISEDIRFNVSASSSFVPDATSFLVVRSAGIDSGARLCLGTYSYIWNYAKAFYNSDVSLTKYESLPAGRTNDIRLVKVADGSKVYCQKRANSNDPLYANIRSQDSAASQEILKAGDRKLAISEFTLTSNSNMYDGTTGQRLYEASFTLAAGNVSAMNASQTACLMPGDINSDLSYCVVQKFTLVIRAGNRVN